MFYIAFVVDVGNPIVGCVAQLVEQLTLNQWVWGSNPHAPTSNRSRLKEIKAAFLFLKVSIILRLLIVKEERLYYILNI